jgi:uncharacterized membrane protein YraQ (UPF0718 family)
MTLEESVVEVLLAGINGLVTYLSAHVLICLIPAFFIAGALAALFKKEAVTKYLGPDTPKYISYPIASMAGLLIAVCSCTILPLFAGIWKKGAGLGPAVTFLFTGPAINVLAILYTGSLIGWDIASTRGILAISFGIVIGLIMGMIFQRSGSRKDSTVKPTPSQNLQCTIIPKDEAPNKENFVSKMLRYHSAVLFVLLIGILLAGTFPMDNLIRVPLLVVITVVTIVWALKTNTRRENSDWMHETYFFAKMIIPLLLIGVFVAGVATAIVPESVIAENLGQNTLSANTIAVGFGIFMYFPTLVEVPVARMFLDLGMAKGPLLAYLLADPELSIQSVLVIGKIMGKVKTAVYVGLVAVFCIAAGMIFGALIG